MINKLKNWWFSILTIVFLVLDQGFEVLKPLLEEAGLDGKYMNLIRLAYGIYGVVRLQKAWPTKNPEKVQNFADEIGGSKPDPKKDEK